LAVDALSFPIPEGSLYGFIGPNGSGKSTTLRMMLGILLPDAGQVHVLGQRRSKTTDDSTGYLPEERGLYRRMRVNDALTFHANLKNVRQPKERISAWLKKLDIADRGRMRISSLSKGLAQRVQFAAAVVHDPKLLILDEPFSGLDPVSTEQLREIILELKNSGTTVILSTHDMSVAESMCDKVLMLHRGRKVLDGSVEQLKLDNGHESIRLRFADRVPSLDDPDISRVLDPSVIVRG
jgi:ABC-2 type transport system ATP-binding protein